MSDKFRGYLIEYVNDQWVYSDTKQPTATTWQNRPCGHCGMYNTKEGHDGCLGTLPNVINACCGHGNNEEAYLQYRDGSTIRRLEAIKLMEQPE